MEQAYTKYSIVGDENEVTLYFQTNDDEDTGYPGVYAEDHWVIRRDKNRNAIQKAIAQTGGTRQGIGHMVYVYLNDELYYEDRQID
jgi:hypothetical protein